MTVEFLYFDGCPSYAKALDNLIDALALERLPVEVEMIRVRGSADAQVKRFVGSPTIRINGVDIDGKEADSRTYAYCCRSYREGAEVAGWPSVDRIRQALRRERIGA